MKNAFSLLEIIFVIVIIGVIAGIGIPKLVNTKSNASAVSIRQDVNTMINSIQSYYLANGDIEKISDSINLNNNIWNIDNKKVTFYENDEECVSVEIKKSSTLDILEINIFPDVGEVCKKISESGLDSQIYNLN